MMQAYKFLAAGGNGRFSGFTWPVGRWVVSDGALAPCLSGIHACRRDQLLDWLDDDLWEIELDGRFEEMPGMLLAERGRLTRRVDAWSAETARALVEDCARRAQQLGARALSRAGMEEAADSLAAADDLLDLHARALTWAAVAPESAAVITGFAADAAGLARGRRPDTPDLGISIAEPGPMQSDAATAANLAFVVAHVAGLEHAAETPGPSSYDLGFATERERQLAWLLDALGAASGA
jgi:hypothetical protein